jgi:hypothetical protein
VISTHDGTTYDKLGIEGADYNLYVVGSDRPDDVAVSGGGGSVYTWTGSERVVREDTGDADLRDVEVEDTTGLTVGGGGTIFRRDATGWTQEQTPVGENLRGTILGAPDVAVGAGGTVLENP